jgi:hypothetical protein
VQHATDHHGMLAALLAGFPLVGKSSYQQGLCGADRWEDRGVHLPTSGGPVLIYTCAETGWSSVRGCGTVRRVARLPSMVQRSIALRP